MREREKQQPPRVSSPRAETIETRDLGLGTQLSTAVRKRVKRVMWERVGILRDASSLQRAITEFEQIKRANLSVSSRNFVTLAGLIAQAALWREESRGGHYRTDFPEQQEEYRVHSIQRAGAELSSSREINFS